MRRRGKRELAALLTVALLAGSAACGADAGEKDAATGTAEAAAGQDTETAAGQSTDAAGGSTGEPGRDGAVSDAGGKPGRSCRNG